MSEEYDDQLSRVRLMSQGDPTWDLSPNDVAALKAVLSRASMLPDAVMLIRRLCRRVDRLGDTSDLSGKAMDWIKRMGLDDPNAILRDA